ncbi:AraC family transcriptional regulator [Paenibacillus daejeonensis]|uniref:AraC family transcriptional regulator n=1 Tax=Paenibacillus daejeonensis TaxID=135193 RepID=UPI00039C16FF|nr:AraC family transcriptional regulator [Paenibacillus daejeonensis]
MNMPTPEMESLSSVLGHLQADVIMADLQQVDSQWRRDDYVHSFNRMYLILAGQGEITVDGKTYVPQQDQLVVMPCHIRQSYRTDADNAFYKYWCHFTARVGNRDLFELYRFPVCYDLDDPAEATRLFNLLVQEHAKRTPASVLNARAAMLQLIGLVVSQVSEPEPGTASQPGKLAHVARYIEANLDRRMTVDELAQLVHYHPNYFIRAFHAVFGSSPIQYINRRKLDRARQLLSGDQPIGGIARAVGIDEHNFSSMFKSYTGFSPREYRKIMQR